MSEIKEYIERRVAPRIAWYDRRALWSKRMHLALQYTAVVASISLMLLLHIHGMPRLGLALIASLVTLSIAIERIGKYGELWMAYRLAAEAIAAELELFNQRVGPYREGTDQSKLFVERVEQLMSKEAFNWARLVESKVGSISESGMGIIRE